MVEQVRDFAIFMMDTDGRHMTWNEGVLRLTGYDETEFLGLSGSILSQPRTVPEGKWSASCVLL
jgi:PAS domain S-box-containing protein